MEPLKQWVCDVCGKIIETPDDGYVVWGENAEGKIDKIRILHKNNHVGNCKVGCDHDRRYSMSLPLESFLGDEGKVHFLSMIDPGPDFREDYREHIADKRLLLETFRRLQLPYYEEARLYWDKAKADGYFDGANEIWPQSRSSRTSVQQAIIYSLKMLKKPGNTLFSGLFLYPKF